MMHASSPPCPASPPSPAYSPSPPSPPFPPPPHSHPDVFIPRWTDTRIKEDTTDGFATGKQTALAG
eukprot:352354-Chlamydomonas_euryale.AAC.4